MEEDPISSGTTRYTSKIIVPLHRFNNHAISMKLKNIIVAAVAVLAIACTPIAFAAPTGSASATRVKNEQGLDQSTGSAPTERSQTEQCLDQLFAFLGAVKANNEAEAFVLLKNANNTARSRLIHGAAAIFGDFEEYSTLIPELVKFWNGLLLEEEGPQPIDAMVLFIAAFAQNKDEEARNLLAGQDIETRKKWITTCIVHLQFSASRAMPVLHNIDEKESELYCVH